MLLSRVFTQEVTQRRRVWSSTHRVLVFGRTRLTFDILPVLHLIRKTLNWSNPRGAWAAFDGDQGRVEEHKKTGSAGSLGVRYRSDPGMESQAAPCGSVGYR